MEVELEGSHYLNVMNNYNFDGYARLSLALESETFLEGIFAVPDGMHAPAHHHITLAFPARSETWSYLEGERFKASVRAYALGVRAQALVVELPPFLARACQNRVRVPHITWGLLGDTPPAESNAMFLDPTSVIIPLPPIEIGVYGDFYRFPDA